MLYDEKDMKQQEIPPKVGLPRQKDSRLITRARQEEVVHSTSRIQETQNMRRKW